MRERRTTGWDLWEDAPCGLLIAATDGTVLRANATLSRWLGYDLPELIGHKRFPDLMPIGARVFLQTHWTPLLQMQGSVSEVQLDLLHKDGHRVPMMLSAIRRQRNGAMQDEIALLRATDRKLFERELIAARARAEAATSDLQLAQSRLRLANDALALEDRRKDEFLATLAHELRNPLAPMSNILATMRLRGVGAGPAARELDVLTRQVVQMTRLVDDLMNVSRISQGKIDLRLEPTDLVQTLQFVAEEAVSSVRAAGQSLRVPVTPRQRVVGSPMTLGIRPEHLVLGSGDVNVSVLPAVIERLGINTIAYANLASGEPFCALLPGAASVQTGQEFTVGIRAEDCHLFDADGWSLARQVDLSKLGMPTLYPES